MNNKNENSWLQWGQTKISGATKKLTSVVKECYAKLPKLSKKKVLAGSLLFLRGVSSYQVNSQESALVNNSAITLGNNNNETHTHTHTQIINHDPNCKIIPFCEEVLSGSVSSSGISEFIIDNYKALDLDIDASEEEIRKSYKKLSLRWHPDKNLHNVEVVTEQFQIIQNAYQIIQEIFQIESLLKSENVAENINELVDWSASERKTKTIEYPENLPNINPLPSTEPFSVSAPRSVQPKFQPRNSFFPMIFAEAAETSPSRPTTNIVSNLENDTVNTMTSFSRLVTTVGAFAGGYWEFRELLGEKETELVEEPDEQNINNQENNQEEPDKEKDESPKEPKEDKQKKIDAELQAIAIAAVNKHWEDNATNGKIDYQNKEQILNHGLTTPIDTWEKDIQAQTGKEAIEAKRDTYIQKIDVAKKEEIRKRNLIVEDDEEKEKERKPKPKKVDEQPDEQPNKPSKSDGSQIEESNQTNNIPLARGTFEKFVLPAIVGVSVVVIITLLVKKVIRTQSS